MKPSSAIATVVGLFACTGCTEPSWNRSLGLIQEGFSPLTSLTAPDTVRARLPFEITVQTFGSGSCTRADGYEVDIAPLWVEVRQYDLTAPSGTACTLDYHGLPRTVPIRFDSVGTGQIVLVGRGRQILKAVVVLPE
jgi:hypothetical protein